MWQVWRIKFGWDKLCPVVAADSLGFFVIMPWAEQPVSDAEARAAQVDYYPEITAETKAADYGRVAGRVVALDYGLPEERMVRDRRAYYACKNGPAVAA
jgi:hypothetical protein